jgi:DNA invertase Pin-like site-specific DNA recombinase
MIAMIYGYARVSTDGQSIFADCSTSLTPAVLIVTRFRSLGDTWADTTTAHGRLMLTVLGGLKP